MAARKLIEFDQEFLIVCDNKTCDFKLPNPTRDPNLDTEPFINTACPKCGENLLTAKDHWDGVRLMKIVNWVNKWLSWTLFFVPKNAPTKSIRVHVHEGVHFSDTPKKDDI